MLFAIVLSGCFGPFDPSDPPPSRTSDPDETVTTSTNGLVAWWTCNDTGRQLTDTLGNYNGTMIDCSSDSGIEGGAIRMNGSTSYIAVNNSDEVNPFYFDQGDFTVSVWVLPEIVLQKPDSVRYDIVALGEAKESGFVLTINQNKFAVILGEYMVLSSDDDFPANANKWRHVVLTRSDGEVSLFIDNTLVLSFDNTTSISFSESLPLMIGISSRSDYRYQGLIDEIKILNTAWGATDVSREYGRFGS